MLEDFIGSLPTMAKTKWHSVGVSDLLQSEAEAWGGWKDLPLWGGRTAIWEPLLSSATAPI